MDRVLIISYLQDIVDLETRKAISVRTYANLKEIEKQNRKDINTVIKAEPSEAFLKVIVRFLTVMFGGSLCIIGYSFLFAFLDWIFHLPDFLNFKIAHCFLGLVVLTVILLIKDYMAFENAKARNKKQREHAAVLQRQIQPAIAELEKAYFECKMTLDNFYSLQIIPDKYQGLAPCAMFLEYLKIGRTHSLESTPGDIGAYNLYEDELYKRKIINKLDQVLENQKLLYNEVCNINQTVGQLCESVAHMSGSLDRIEKNSNINAWCNTVTSINISAMRRMHEEYYRFKR